MGKKKARGWRLSLFPDAIGHPGWFAHSVLHDVTPVKDSGKQIAPRSGSTRLLGHYGIWKLAAYLRV